MAMENETLVALPHYDLPTWGDVYLAVSFIKPLGHPEWVFQRSVESTS